VNICEACGGRIETPGKEGVCYACYLDGLIPPGYELLENYVFDPGFRHRNATDHPPTGVQILDDTPVRIRDVCRIYRVRISGMRGGSG